MGCNVWLGWVAILLLLGGCATTLDSRKPVSAPADRLLLPNNPLEPPWQPIIIRFKTPTEYSRAVVDGMPCILGEAKSSWSLLGARVSAPYSKASNLSWRWHVPNLVNGADNESRDRDDAPVRLVVAFKGDRETIDAVDRAAMNMAKLIGGWEIPFASIQYIWEADAKVETIINHHTVSRIKKIVVRSGSQGLGSWVDLERDVRADFRRAFAGEEPGEIESIGLMTDTDTLHGNARGCYADIVLR
ncbi:MAG: DUF3047 domain-containing protein [Betaproteobacteria bacterium]|nr:MAG: DUF3047 domain-containing protein [Betaproteobacteria bacterium]